MSSAAEAAEGRTPKPCAGVYVAPTWLSDYRFDGFSESNREPTWQLVIHCYRSDGLYAGTELTRVKFLDSPPTGLEADFYAGKHLAVARSDLNLELLYTSFPDKRAPGPSYDMFEAQAEFSHTWRRVTLKSLLGWSPNYSGETGQAWHLKETASITLASWLAVRSQVGRLWIDRGRDRIHFETGITATTGRFAFDLRYAGTNLSRDQCYGLNWCAPGAAVSLSYRALP